jgi:hypothetical protein
MRTGKGKRATKRNGVGVKGGGSRTVKVAARLSKQSTTKVAPVSLFVRRLGALQLLGLRRTQITKIVGVSYSAIHGFLSGRISPSEDRLREYNTRVDKWAAQAKRV